MLVQQYSTTVFRPLQQLARLEQVQLRKLSSTIHKMATVNNSLPHMQRTAHEPRQAGMWQATLSKIDQVNSTIRLLRLSLQSNQLPLRHLPGQYVDLHIPDIPTVGGFTITSPPQTALPSRGNTPYIELAIQRSPSNPPAAYLWQPVKSILDALVSFKVGGNFAFPPLSLKRQECESIDRAVFIAGGVGINPIMSMISAMDARGAERVGGMPKTVRVLYSSRRPRAEAGEEEEILFEHRLAALAAKWDKTEGVDYAYELYETGENTEQKQTKSKKRRIQYTDLIEALGPEESRKNTVVYICGVPTMTDEFVDLLRKQPGMDERRVMCEKWW